MKIYHSTCANNKNFGDILGPYIVEKLTNHTVEYAEPAQSDAVIIGSILEHLPEHYKGIVAGIGVAKSFTRKNLMGANVRALRGPYTLKKVQVRSPKKILLADPGLLAPFVVDVSNVEKEYKYGVINHYNDKTIPNVEEANIINITSGIEHVITEAAKCENIIASSLHGIILADSLMIPRKWAMFDRVQGRGLKFTDYNASVDLKPLRNVWQQPDEILVKRKQEKLLELFTCL